MGMVDGSKKAGAWWPAQKFWFQAKVQLVWIRLHLFLDFLLVVVDLPGDVNMHSTPLARFPQHGPERICQPWILL